MSIQVAAIRGDFLNMGLSAFGETLTVTPIPVAGWNFTYNINTDIVNTALTGSGAVTQANGKALLSTGGADMSSATIRTNRFVRYTPGLGGLARFTAIFDTPAVGNTQVIGVGNDNDGYFFGYQDDEFGVFRRDNGVNFFTPQSQWNVNRLPNLNHQTGNVYAIAYQWLGFGDIAYTIEERYTGKLTIVHVDFYANSHTETSIRNPTLPLYAKVENDGTDDTIVLQTASAMGFVQGERSSLISDPLAFSRSFNRAVTLSAGVEGHIISIGMVDPYQTIENRLIAALRYLTLATAGTKTVLFNLYANATITTPTWVNFNLGTSALRSDIAGTISGGSLITSFTLGTTDSLAIDMDSFVARVFSAYTLTLTGLSANANDIQATLNFSELF